MNSHQQQSRGGEEQKPAAGHATTAGTATTLVDTSDGGIGMGELWDTLTSEFTNMGYALRCPLCLCTYKEAVLLPCCHAYCKDCVLAAFQQSQPRCPTCLIKANKRSLQPADILNQLVHAYKVSLRHFGLAPVTYDPSYNAMTQLGPGESPEKGMMSMEPLTRYNDDASSSSTRALLDCHTHLQVSRTWQSVLQERQELRDEEDNTDDDDDSDDDDEKSRAVDVDLNPKQTSKTTATASVPSNIPTKSRLHHWYQQQQAQVIASHERALIVAAREKRESNSSPVFNLSEQHEIAYEQALEQSAADQRWTQESGTASAGASASQAFLTPREADSNPQQQQQQQQQPIPSLSAAESFETTLEEEHPVKLRRDEMEADKYKSDKSEDVTMQEETTKENIEGDQGKEEEDSVMDDTEEHNTSTSTTNAINNSTRATPQQSNTMAYRQTNDAKAEDSDDETVFDIDDDGKNKDATNEDPMEVDDNDNINTATTTRNNMDVPMNQEAECKDDNDDDDDKGIAAENTSIVNQERNNHADAQDNNATTSDSNNATAGAANASLATPTSPSALQFKKGDIVHVQSRTWPGVNKQGGIGRVTKVNAKSSSYHIEYILGGREKDVDAVFVSNPPDEIAIIKEEPNNTSDDNETTKNNACSGRERKSRRILKKEQHIDTAINPEDVLPPELMERLAKEGFDVTPTAANGAGKENAVPGGGVRVKTEPGVRRGRTNNNGRSTRSRSETRRGRTSTAASTRRAKSEGAQSRTTNARTGNSRGRSKKQPLQDTKIPATNTDSDKNVPAEKNDNSEESKKATAAKAIAKKITVKATKASAKGKQPASSKSALNTITAANKRQKTAASDSPTKLPPLPDSTAEICKLADANYQERIQGALDGGVLTIVSSGLSEIDKSDLKTLCREAKKNGNVQIKQTENFHANKITLCVMPAVPSEEDSANLVGHCRTLKAMRSALAGIPIVSTSWISACRSQKQADMPFADMFVRTLPVKKGANSRSKAFADYGVAKIAAQASQRANHTLRSCIIHLLGSFTRPSKADVQLLLRESGAIVSLQTSTILATLRNAQNTDEQQVVLMCDDNYTHVTGALQRQVKATLESQTVESLIVVNPQWLFDSIISGGPANADEYAPTGKQPRELWELLQSKS